MPDYYPFAQKADRLIAVELSFIGTVRPLLVTNARNQAGGLDTLFIPPVQLAPDQSVNFTLAVDRPADRAVQNWGFSAVEFFGWRPGTSYAPVVPEIALNLAWPMGKAVTQEFPRNGVGEFDLSQPIASADYQFTRSNGDWTLSWSYATGASVQKRSVNLTEDLHYAYVVLRLVDRNVGQISFRDLAFGAAKKKVFRSTAPAALLVEAAGKKPKGKKSGAKK